MTLKVGDISYYTRTISESDIHNFVSVTGDFNPMTVNKFYMNLVGQKKSLVPNVFLQGLISASLGAKMPGFGTIYLGQETEFLIDVYEDDTIIIQSEVIEIQEKKSFNIALIRVNCYNQNNTLVATGVATVIPPKEKITKMVIKPEFKGAVSKNPHPLGCKEAVARQIEFVKQQGKYEGPKKVLIIGASSGYGLATRISTAFGSGADTIGVSFELGVSDKRVGTAGWWNNIWFKEFAQQDGLIAKNFVGDAFSTQIKQDVIKYVKEKFGGKIDLIVYSLASGRRTDPKDGKTYNSVLKNIDHEVNAPTIDLAAQKLTMSKMEKASKEEIANTVKVMGGEDWKLWIEALKDADVLAEGCVTTAYSYEGPRAMYDIYEGGTIGAAKRDLEQKAKEIQEELNSLNGQGFVAVAKALVTKASAYIPLFPIYCSILYKVMKKNGTHENCIAQINRFLREMVYGDKRIVDDSGRVRPDNWEMDAAVQAEVEQGMATISDDNLFDVSDFQGFLDEFLELNGFGFDNIDYDVPVDIEALEKLTY